MGGDFIEYRDRSLAKFELDILFSEILNSVEVDVISRILIILAEYRILSNDMIFKIYKHKYKHNLKLRFLKKAIKQQLVICHKYNYEYRNSNDDEKDIYFYSLKKHTYVILKDNDIDFFELSVFLSYSDKNRILNFNNYLVQNDIENEYEFIDFKDYRFFIMKNYEVYYYKNEIDINDLKDVLKKLKIEIEKYIFIEIELDQIIDFGSKTTAVNHKNLDI